MKAFLLTHGKYLAVVVLAAAVMLWLWGQINWHILPFSEWDGWHYRKIAEAAPALSAEAREPFRFRLLGPWTIGVLFDNYIAGFTLANYVASLGLVVALYFFLCYVGISRPVATYTSVLFTFNTYLFGVTVWYIFHINDFLALLLLLLGFWAMMERRWAVFAVALFLGALARETWLLLPPTALVLLWERGALRGNVLKLVLAVLPAIAVTVVLRLTMSLVLPGNLEPMQAFIRFAPKVLAPEFWARQFGNTLKPVTFLPLIFLGTTLAFLRANKFMAVFVLLTLVSTLFGSGNERLMAPAFVAFYWLLALIFQRDLWSSKWMLGLVAVACFVASLHYQQARFPLPSRELTVILGGLAWLVVTGAAVVYRLRHWRGGGEISTTAG
ncbi:MAG: hypothetical protein R2844_15320 [Caldilineales bacterium]